MKISKKTEYGLRAMVFLARQSLGVGGLAKGKSKKGELSRPFSMREIADKTKIPFVFLTKIFSKLEKAGLIKAKTGMRGGYFLARPANKITTADVVSVLEEDLAVVHCSGCPMAGGCSSRDVWDEVKESINETMDKKTLADLIK